jgi:hypothetical protein
MLTQQKKNCDKIFGFLQLFVTLTDFRQILIFKFLHLDKGVNSTTFKFSSVVG